MEKSMSDAPAIGHAVLNEIRSEFEAFVSTSAANATRLERRREAILHGDTPTFMEVDVARSAEQLKGADAVVLGFPFEGPTSISPSRSAPPTISRPPAGSIYWRMGADKSPDHIRKYSIFYSKEHNGGYHPEIDAELVLHETLRVVDYGNCTYHAEDTMLSIREGIERVGHIIDAGAVPFVLGGDHTTPYPVLKAILSRRSAPIGLVVFDGHVDFSVTPGEYWASNQWTQLMLETGKLAPSNITIIGIRSSRNAIAERQLAERLGVKVFTSADVKRLGMAAVVQEAVARATRDTEGLYVSIDIDCMEPALVPSQKAQEIWGLTIDEMFVALQTLSRQPFIGFDVCEHSPDYDINGQGAQFCARTVVEMMGGLALRRRAEKRRSDNQGRTR
jgi:arginase family enzyme